MGNISLQGRRLGRDVPPGDRLSSLVGREDDLRRMISLLERDDARLVTLVGPGGVGKTRLAHKVAERIGNAFEHGVVCVSLEHALDFTMVPREVVRALGLREHPLLRAVDLVAETLAGAHLLLVLDGFEHVTGARVWLLDLLSRAPHLTVLVTSRLALDAPGEHQYAVGPLTSDAAAALFQQRATEVNPSFFPDAGDASIAEICRRLGGLPLAIELTAALMRDLSPADLLQKLEGHPESAPGLPGFRWAYDLLEPACQMLLCRLAMFPGGFSVEAAEFVACWPDSPGGDAASETLRPLQDRSLVRAHPEHGPLMFHVHQAIRDIDPCHSAPDGDDLGPMAFAEYYRSLAARAETGLVGPDQIAWMDLLEREFPNIRHAVAWLEMNDRLHHAIELLSRIQYFISIRGYTVEILERMEGWLDSTMLVPWSPEHGLARLTLGRLYQNAGQLELSVRMLTEAAAGCLANGDLRHAAMAKTLLASSYALMGLPDEVEALASEALELARPLDMHRFVAAALSWLSWHADGAGDTDRADALYREAQRIAIDTGDRWAMSFGLGRLAISALERGELDEAWRLATELRDILNDLGSLHDLTNVVDLLGSIAEARGDRDLAADLVDQSLALAGQCGNRQLVAMYTIRAARLAIRRDRLDDALGLLSGLVEHQDVPEIRIVPSSDVLDTYANLAFRAGDCTEAARFIGAASGPAAVSAPDDHALAEPLRTRLGANAFDRELATGAAWDTDAALGIARAYRPSSSRDTVSGQSLFEIDDTV